MKTRQITSLEDLEQNWKRAYIPSLPRMKRTKKNLIEGFNLGIKIYVKGGEE